MVFHGNSIFILHGNFCTIFFVFQLCGFCDDTLSSALLNELEAGPDLGGHATPGELPVLKMFHRIFIIEKFYPLFIFTPVIKVHIGYICKNIEFVCTNPI